MFNFEDKTILLNGLPGINYDGKWIIYSPYAKKIALFKNIQNIDNIKETLKKKGFFGQPKQSIGGLGVSKVILITTTLCNLNCKYCYEAKDNTRNKIMDKEMAINVIRNSIKENTKELKIIFFGGEPTLNMDLIKSCVKYVLILKIPSSFQISTNGVVSQEVLDYLIEHRFTIQISADGISEIQDQQRPKKDNNGSSAEVEKTISYLVKNDYQFKIRMTVTKYALEYLLDSIKYFGKLGVKYIHIEGVSNSDGYNKNEYTELDTEKFAEMFIKALNEAKKFGIKIINSAYMNIIEPATKFCGGLCGNQIVVNPEGDISTCYEVQDHCHPSAKSLMVGKYDFVKKKLDIEGSKIENIKHLSADTFEKCKDCFAKFICSGGCPIRNGLLAGNAVSNNYCDSTKFILFNLIKEIYKLS